MEPELAVDNRRTTVRVLAQEILRGLTALSRLHRGDLIEALVFTTIWSANTHHLVGPGARYASMYDLPPDSQRRPVSLEDMRTTLCIPDDILMRYLDDLVSQGYCERTAGGYVVPTAVFKRPEMLDGLNDFYTQAVNLVSALRQSGFSVGEPA